MTTARYAPGGGVGLIGSRLWAVLDAVATDALVGELWAVNTQDATLARLVDVLLARGVSAIPSFALLAANGDGQLRLVVRGDAVAEVQPRSGDAVRVEALDLYTWVEQPVEEAAQVRLLLRGSGPKRTLFPTDGGIVLTDHVEVLVDASSGGTTASAGAVAAASPQATGGGSATDTTGEAETAVPASSDGRAGRPKRPARDNPAATASGDGTEPPPADEPAPVSAPAAPGPDVPAPTETVAIADYLLGFAAPAAAGAPDTPAAKDPDDAQPPGAGSPEPVTVLPSAAEAAPSAPPEPPAATPSDVRVKRPPQSPAAAGPGELITVVPWGRSASSDTPPAPPTPAPLVVPPPPVRHEPAALDERTARRAPVAAPDTPRAADTLAPMVHAVRCAAGHLNAPQSGHCRRCSVPLPEQEPVTVPRPVLGVLRLSTGDDVTLDRDVLVGRRPRLTGDAATRPHLVQVNNPGNDVSRNHVAVLLDGWHVLLKDLGSTNGTLVRMPGEEPQRLRAEVPVPMRPGTEVVLADGVSFRYEVEP